MTLKLFFLRHGYADRDQWQGVDSERPLTEAGIAAMQKIATFLKHMHLDLELIITSPYQRALQTAEIVAQSLSINKDCFIKDQRLAPGFGFGGFKEIGSAYPDVHSILLVGHEPDFSLLIKRLIGGGNLVMKKAGLARVDIVDRQSFTGELIWLCPPKLICFNPEG